MTEAAPDVSFPRMMELQQTVAEVVLKDPDVLSVAAHPGWARGIRIGSYSTGEVKYRIPDPDNLKGTGAAEGIAVDAAGNIYGAEVGTERLSRYSLDPSKR